MTGARRSLLVGCVLGVWLLLAPACGSDGADGADGAGSSSGARDTIGPEGAAHHPGDDPQDEGCPGPPPADVVDAGPSSNDVREPCRDQTLSCHDGALVGSGPAGDAVLLACPDGTCGAGGGAALCASDAARAAALWFQGAPPRPGSLRWTTHGSPVALTLRDEDGVVRFAVARPASSAVADGPSAATVHAWRVEGADVTLQLTPGAAPDPVAHATLVVGAAVPAADDRPVCAWRLVAGQATLSLADGRRFGLAWAPVDADPWTRAGEDVPVVWALLDRTAPPPDPDCHWDCFGGVACAAAEWIVPRQTGLVVQAFGPVPCAVADAQGWDDPLEICAVGAPPAVVCPAGCDPAGAPLCADDATALAATWPDGAPVADGTLTVGPDDTLRLAADDGTAVLTLESWGWCGGDAQGASGVVREQGVDLASLPIEGSAPPVAAATVTRACFADDDGTFHYPAGRLDATLVDGRTVRIAWRPVGSGAAWVPSGGEARASRVSWTRTVE